MDPVVTEGPDWFAELSETGDLTPELTSRILAVHGARGRRAIEAVGEQRVKQYRDFIVVVGHGDEYIVENGECECKDVQYNLDPEDPSDRCWHALAYEIATRVNAIDEHDLWYSDVRDLMDN